MCPCLQSFPSSVPAESDGRIIITTAGSTYRYPPNYGLGNCSSFDAALPPYCARTSQFEFDESANPSWCMSSWCYIDPNECNVAVVPSPSTYFPAETNLYYSYEVR